MVDLRRIVSDMIKEEAEAMIDEKIRGYEERANEEWAQMHRELEERIGAVEGLANTLKEKLWVEFSRLEEENRMLRLKLGIEIEVPEIELESELETELESELQTDPETKPETNPKIDSETEPDTAISQTNPDINSTTITTTQIQPQPLLPLLPN